MTGCQKMIEDCRQHPLVLLTALLFFPGKQRQETESVHSVDGLGTRSIQDSCHIVYARNKMFRVD